VGGVEKGREDGSSFQVVRPHEQHPRAAAAGREVLSEEKQCSQEAGGGFHQGVQVQQGWPGHQTHRQGPLRPPTTAAFTSGLSHDDHGWSMSQIMSSAMSWERQRRLEYSLNHVLGNVLGETTKYSAYCHILLTTIWTFHPPPKNHVSCRARHGMVCPTCSCGCIVNVSSKHHFMD
jgi:hypothetical protein